MYKSSLPNKKALTPKRLKIVLTRNPVEKIAKSKAASRRCYLGSRFKRLSENPVEKGANSDDKFFACI